MPWEIELKLRKSPAIRYSLLRSASLVVALVLLSAFSDGPTDGGDAARDAAGKGQLFESVAVSGLTDVIAGTDGISHADINKDGLIDMIVIRGGARAASLDILLNRGEGRFTRGDLNITAENQPFILHPGASVANLADFNSDGFLDMLIVKRGVGANTRGEVLNEPGGPILLLSDGAWNKLKDVTRAMGLVTPHPIYQRQSTLGDVNNDGFMDILIAADNIANAWAGLPWQQLLVYRGSADGVFEHGHFQDVGGTSVIPGFGGVPTCRPGKDKGGPNSSMVDVDGDGDLDIVQTMHNDMTTGALWSGACASANMLQGMFAWKNMLVESGQFRFEPVTTAPFDRTCTFSYNQELKIYDYVGACLSHPYANWLDADNDGDFDLITLGVLDYTWHVDSERLGVSYQRNDGGFRFTELTGDTGLEPIAWTYGQWNRFWKANIPRDSSTATQFKNFSQQKPHLSGQDVHTVMAYSAGLVPGDFNNDGWTDFIYVNRHELDGAWGELRNVLFINERGRFRPTTTEFSGIDTNSIAGDAVDLNNDGLLDLVFNMDPDHSYHNRAVPLPRVRYQSRAFLNSGMHGARENAWARIQFSGAPHAVLMKSIVKAYHAGTRTLLGARLLTSNASYKAGSPIETHFGLAGAQAIDIEITPPGYQPITFRNLAAREIHALQIDPNLLTPVRSSR